MAFSQGAITGKSAGLEADIPVFTGPDTLDRPGRGEDKPVSVPGLRRATRLNSRKGNKTKKSPLAGA